MLPFLWGEGADTAVILREPQARLHEALNTSPVFFTLTTRAAMDRI